jgi:hypothetical protein
MDVQEYIRSECDRQHVTNYDDFQAALEYSTTVSRWFPAISFSSFVQRIAQLVEPSVNDFYHNGATFTNLRRSEVGFLHGGEAVKPLNRTGDMRLWRHSYF